MLNKNKIWNFSGVSALVVSLVATGAHADDSSTSQQSFEQRIQAVEQQLQALKAQQAAQNATATTPASISSYAGQDGFGIASDDGQYTLNFHALLQADGRFFPDGPRSQSPALNSDTFTLRRVEPSIQGQLTDLFSYNITPEYGGSPTSTVSTDMYGEFHFSPQYFNLRIGKFKEPFSLENLQSSGSLAFVERGYPTNLSPNRSLGLQVAGTLGNNQLVYALGVFNGAPDGGDAAPTDFDSHKEFVTRIFAQPWHDGSKGVLDNLGFGIAGSIAREDGGAGLTGTNGLLPFYTTPGQNSFFKYMTAVFADGPHTRISPQASYYYGGFSALAEYVLSRQAVGLTTTKPAVNVANQAGEVTLGYVLTGENASYSGIKPLHPYSISGLGWGAFEVVARVGTLIVDKDAFSFGLAGSTTASSVVTNAQRANSVGLGLNWYLNKNVKLVFDYEQTSFVGGAGTVAKRTDRPDEHALLFRSQYSF